MANLQALHPLMEYVYCHANLLSLQLSKVANQIDGIEVPGLSQFPHIKTISYQLFVPCLFGCLHQYSKLLRSVLSLLILAWSLRRNRSLRRKGLALILLLGERTSKPLGLKPWKSLCMKPVKLLCKMSLHSLCVKPWQPLSAKPWKPWKLCCLSGWRAGAGSFCVLPCLRLGSFSKESESATNTAALKTSSSMTWGHGGRGWGNRRSLSQAKLRLEEQGKLRTPSDHWDGWQP